MKLDLDSVVEQYHALGSCKKVGELYNCNGETIRRLLLKNGVKLTGWRQQKKEKMYRFKRSPEADRFVLETFMTTRDIKECSQHCKCSTTTVYKILEENDIHCHHENAWINSPQAAAVAEYYVAGHSVGDTAERFGVSRDQVNNLAKARGLTNGRGYFLQARVSDQKEEAERRLAEQLGGVGFEYVGGYTDKDGKAKIRCRECGAIFERSVHYLRKKYDSMSCPECVKREKERLEEERKQKARQEAAVKAWERKWYRLTHPRKTGYEITHDAFLDRAGICKICGKPYVVRDYVKACGLKMARDSGVCSPECRDENNRRNRRRSHIGRQDSHRHRAKRFGSAYDPTISLKKLVDRDGLKCAICGGMCDWNDHSWSEYSGPTYPSIDHIIPMAKGGPHTWDNVQVAHIICNSYKGDSTEEGLEYDAG